MYQGMSPKLPGYFSFKINIYLYVYITKGVRELYRNSLWQKTGNFGNFGDLPWESKAEPGYLFCQGYFFLVTLVILDGRFCHLGPML